MRISSKIKVLLPGLLLVLAASVAQAVPDEEVETAADLYNRNKSSARYKVVCQKEAPIGSRIKKQVCRTVSVIDRSALEARRTMDRLRTSIKKQP